MPGNAEIKYSAREQFKCIRGGLLAKDVSNLMDTPSETGKDALKLVLPAERWQFAHYNLSSLFECYPKMDPISIGVGRNGYDCFKDLHLSRLSDIFSGLNLRLDQKREFLEILKSHIGFELKY